MVLPDMGGRWSAKQFWVVAILSSLLLIPTLTFLPTVSADPPFSASVKVNDDALTVLPGSRNYPSLAIVGGTAVVLTSVVENHSPDLHVSRSSDGGSTWQADVRVDSDPYRGEQIESSLTLGPSGELVAAWKDSRGAGTDIYVATSVDAGSTWSSPDVRVNSGNASAWQFDPAVAVDALGGINVVWSDSRDGDSDIYFARSSDGGLSWTSPDVRINDAAHATGFYPSIALSSSGTILVAWAGESADPLRNDQDIYVARSTDEGATWNAPASVTTGPAAQASAFWPSLAAGPNGSLLIAWSDYRDGPMHVFAARSLDDGITWTDPNVRVSPSTPNQEYPWAIVTESGFGVGWIDNRNGSLDVYYARSADGATWTEAPVVTVGGPMRYELRIAADGPRVYAVWQEDRSGFGLWEVHLARSDDGGGTWSPAVRLPDGPPSRADQTNPSIQVGRNGAAYALWMDHRDRGSIDYPLPPGDVYFSRSTDGGATWLSPSVRVSPSGAEGTPAVLRIAPNGNLHAVWQDLQRRLVSSRSMDEGSTWTTPISICSDPSIENQIEPDLAIDAQGRLVLVWRGYAPPDFSGYLSRSIDGGASWSAPVAIPALGHSFTVAVDGFGGIYVAWTDSVSWPSPVMVSRTPDGGATWSPAIYVKLIGADQLLPRLAVSTDDTVHIVWESYEPGLSDIYYSRSTDRGAIWSAPSRLNRDLPLGNRYSPAIAMGPMDDVYVAWADWRGTDHDLYLASSLDGGLNWTADYRVNDDVPGSHQLEPSLVVDNRRGIYAAWRDNRTGDWDIRAARVAPSLVDAVPPELVTMSLLANGTAVTSVPQGTEVGIRALASDVRSGGSVIASANATVDGGPAITLAAEDGAFDEVEEMVGGSLSTNAISLGTHAVCMYATDAEGNTNATGLCGDLAVTAPPESPVVAHTAVTTGQIGVPIPIAFNVSRGDALTYARVYYRLPGEVSFSLVNASCTAGACVAEIPAAREAGALHYYIEVSDGTFVVAFPSEGAAAPIEVTILQPPPEGGDILGWAALLVVLSIIVLASSVWLWRKRRR